MPKNEELYTIQGELINAETRAFLVGYYIRAFDVDAPDEDDFLGEGQVNKQGQFQISYRQTQFVKTVRESFTEGGPDLLLKIYDRQKYLIDTTEPREGAARFESYQLAVKLPLRHKPPRPLLVSGRLQVGAAKPNLAELQVGLYRQDERRPRPLYVTDVAGDGRFQFSINSLEAKRRLSQLEKPLYVGVLHQGRLIHATADQAILHLSSDNHIVELKLPDRVWQAIDRKPLPVPETTIEQLVRAADLPEKQVPQIVEAFQKANIRELRDFFVKRWQFDPAQVGLDQRSVARLASLAKFNVATGSLSLSQTLVRNGVTSFTALARVPNKRLARMLPADSRARQQLKQAHTVARQVSSAATLAMIDKQRGRAPDAGWYGRPNTAESEKKEKTCQSCQPCDSIFSPLAYLFDLLDFVYYQWNLTSDFLEKLFLQEIDALDCQKGLEPVRQIELAILVLEKYLKRHDLFPLDDAALKERLRQKWLSLFPAKQIIQWGNSEFMQLLDQPLTYRTLKKIYELLKAGGGRDGIGSGAAGHRFQNGHSLAQLESVYNAVLETYRSALIDATGETVAKLQGKLFIKLRMGGCFENNRITQLIQSLQDFILSIRTGEIAAVQRDDLQHELNFDDLVTVPVEETGWQWLRDYKTWASAVYAVVFTENVLPPPTMIFQDKHFNNDDEDDVGGRAMEKMFIGQVSRSDVLAAFLRYNFSPLHISFLRSAAADAGDWEESLHQLIDMIDGQSRGLSMETCLSLIQTVKDRFSEITGVYISDYYYPKQVELVRFYLLAGWALNHSGEHAAAHDWYRQLYDPEAPIGERYGFDFEELFNGDLQDQYGNWFTRALDPHSLANRRSGVYLRHTILMMVRNLLDWADHEYALATPVSIDRARHLYELAERTLQAPDLADECGRAIAKLALDFVTHFALEPEFDPGSMQGVLDDLNSLRDPAILNGVIDDIYVALEKDPGNIDPIREHVQAAVLADRAQWDTAPVGEMFYEGQRAAQVLEDDILFSANGHGAAPIFFLSAAPYGAAGFPADGTHDGTGAVLEAVPVSHSASFCVPPNPLLKAYQAYIAISLFKLDACLNIAGEPLPAAVLSDETVRTFTQGLNTELERETLLDAQALSATDQPRYRYSYVVEKARQYTELAQRLGSMLLSTYEKLDEERYRKLTADQALEMASETITLKQLASDSARLGLQVSTIQANRASFQANWWQERLDNNFMGMSGLEWTGVGLMVFSGGLQALAGTIQGAGAIAAGIAAGTGGAGAGGVATSESGPFAALGAGVGAVFGSAVGIGVGAALPGTVQALGSFAGAASTFGSVALTLGSFERRWEEWNFQNELALFDQNIAQLQTELANQQIEITNQELTIANLNQTHAEEVLTFLSEGQFSNEALYHWMATVLRQNYYTTMQMATTFARMAQSALIFERQQTIQIIEQDYWTIDTDYAAQLSDTQKDSGLLGAERLLTDLTRLDAYKLTTDKRRLEISKTVSMAQRLPGELIHLRQNGWVSFNTLLDWFDEDYPGHYLRLIKSVKVTLVALVPPIHGIHATLRNEGTSTVVVKTNEGFEPLRAMRSYPESIALDAAYNDTGLFTLDPRDPMYLPFEGLGVETEWTLMLPRPNNHFNFETIVDVLFTIDYTALHDRHYEYDIRQAQHGEQTADVVLDVKSLFPDEWYHFANPLPNPAAEAPHQLELALRPTMLPQVLNQAQDILVQQVTLFIDGRFENLTAAETALVDGLVVRKDSTPIAFKQQESGEQLLVFTTRTAATPSPAIDGLLTAEGQWQIVVGDHSTEAGRELLSRINNMMLVITIKGETYAFTPPWLTSGTDAAFG